MAKEENKKEGVIGRSWPFMIFFVLFTAVSIVFGILCIDGMKIEFLQNYKGIVIALAIASAFSIATGAIGCGCHDSR